MGRKLRRKQRPRDRPRPIQHPSHWLIPFAAGDLTTRGTRRESPTSRGFLSSRGRWTLRAYEERDPSLRG